MTLDEAQDGFRSEPNHTTAQAYATALIAYHADDMIGPDTFRDYMIEIATTLTDGRNALGWPVKVEVKAA